jgi:hypothetical protein
VRVRAAEAKVRSAVVVKVRSAAGGMERSVPVVVEKARQVTAVVVKALPATAAVVRVLPVTAAKARPAQKFLRLVRRGEAGKARPAKEAL